LMVNIEYVGHVKSITGNGKEEVEARYGSSVADLLNVLAKRYGEPFMKAIYEPKSTDVKSNYIVTVNGFLLNQLRGLDTELKNGDHVAILPVVSGG